MNPRAIIYSGSAAVAAATIGLTAGCSDSSTARNGSSASGTTTQCYTTLTTNAVVQAVGNNCINKLWSDVGQSLNWHKDAIVAGDPLKHLVDSGEPGQCSGTIGGTGPNNNTSYGMPTNGGILVVVAGPPGAAQSECQVLASNGFTQITPGQLGAQPAPTQPAPPAPAPSPSQPPPAQSPQQPPTSGDPGCLVSGTCTPIEQQTFAQNNGITDPTKMDGCLVVGNCDPSQQQGIAHDFGLS